MKKIKPITATAFFFVAILYLLISFACWDFYPKHWDDVTRSAFSVLSVLLMIIATMIHTIND